MRGTNRPLGALTAWVRRQPPKVKAFLAVVTGMAALVFIRFIVHDHDHLFVAAEAAHALGIGVLVYKLTKEKAYAVDEACTHMKCSFGGICNGGGGARQKNLFVASFFFDRAAESNELMKLKRQLDEFIEERQSWLDEINQRQSELGAARMTIEKLRQKEHFMVAEIDLLKAENANYKTIILNLEDEVKKLTRSTR